jgi:hypothetical protein
MTGIELSVVSLVGAAAPSSRRLRAVFNRDSDTTLILAGF